MAAEKQTIQAGRTREPSTALMILRQERSHIAVSMQERTAQLESYQQAIARIIEMNERDIATLASIDEAIAKLKEPITLSEAETRITTPNFAPGSITTTKLGDIGEPK